MRRKRGNDYFFSYYFSSLVANKKSVGYPCNGFGSISIHLKKSIRSIVDITKIADYIQDNYIQGVDKKVVILNWKKYS
jgi:hypothetical protein